MALYTDFSCRHLCNEIRVSCCVRVLCFVAVIICILLSQHVCLISQRHNKHFKSQFSGLPGFSGGFWKLSEKYSEDCWSGWWSGVPEAVQVAALKAYVLVVVIADTARAHLSLRWPHSIAYTTFCYWITLTYNLSHISKLSCSIGQTSAFELPLFVTKPKCAATNGFWSCVMKRFIRHIYLQ